MKNLRKKHPVIAYLLIFLGLFGCLFYGTEMVIGLSAPGNHYNAFVARYLDFIAPFRQSLLQGATTLLSLLGFKAAYKGDVIILQGGEGVRMSYSCLGYGVLSFWIAFVWANRCSMQRKLRWVLGGCFLLWAINILRVSLLVLAVNKNWSIPFGWDHHTCFNLVAYGLIFGMIISFDQADPARRFTGRTQGS